MREEGGDAPFYLSQNKYYNQRLEIAFDSTEVRDAGREYNVCGRAGGRAASPATHNSLRSAAGAEDSERIPHEKKYE
jgi:hypothetical protein